VSFTKRNAANKKGDRFRVRWMSRAPVALLVRTVVLAVFAVWGAAWALHRHYTHELAPMTAPVPTPAPTYDADAGEIPAPELEPPRRP
jgi:hypothetical protein